MQTSLSGLVRRAVQMLREEINPPEGTCQWCRRQTDTYPSGGGYHYCSTTCEEADAEHQQAQL